MDFTGARVINNSTRKRGTIKKGMADYIPARFDIVYDDGTRATYEFPKAFSTTLSLEEPQLQNFVDMCYFPSRKAGYNPAPAEIPQTGFLTLPIIESCLKNLIRANYMPQVREIGINMLAAMAGNCQMTNYGLTDQKKLLDLFVMNPNGTYSFITIVKDSKNQNSRHNIYWADRDLSKAIISALAQDEREYEYRDELYKIVYVKTYPGYQAVEDKWKRLNDPSIQHTIKVFRQKGVYDDAIKGYELVNAKLYFPNKKNVYDVPVYYQSSDDSYFMNSETYDDLVRKYGPPKAEVYYADGSDTHSAIRALNEESRLKQLGYNVQQAEGNSAAYRQQLLKRIIQSGQMKDYEVTDHLEFLIHMKSGLPNMQNACACWKEDLLFVQKEFQDYRRQTDFTQNKIISTPPVKSKDVRSASGNSATAVKKASTPWKPAVSQSWQQQDPVRKTEQKSAAVKSAPQTTGKPGHAKTNYRSGSVNDLSMKRLELMNLKMELNSMPMNNLKERNQIIKKISALEAEIEELKRK